MVGLGYVRPGRAGCNLAAGLSGGQFMVLTTLLEEAR